MKRPMERLQFGRTIEQKSDYEACHPLNLKQVWPKDYYENMLLPAMESYRAAVLGREWGPSDLYNWVTAKLGNSLPSIALTKKPSKEDSYRDQQNKPRVSGKSTTRLMHKIQRYIRRQILVGTIIKLTYGRYKFVISRGYNSKGDRLV